MENWFSTYLGTISVQTFLIGSDAETVLTIRAGTADLLTETKRQRHTTDSTHIKLRVQVQHPVTDTVFQYWCS